MTIAPFRKDSLLTRDADPLRAALREAIAAQHSAEVAVTRQKQAIERASAHRATAEADLEAATAAVESAKGLDAANVAQALHSAAAAVGTPTAARKARAAEQEAQDAVDAATAALARLQADLAGLDEAAKWAGNTVVAAVNAVLAPTVRHLLAESLELKMQLAVNMAIVGSILSADDEVRGFDGAAAARAKTRRDEPFLGLREQLDRLGASVTEQAHERITAALIATQHALAALRTNPAAPLRLGAQS
jgi:hypothetical protein